MTTGFAVPVAITPAGDLVRPEDAAPEVSHRCPGCGRDVVLRRGEHRRAHFAHRGGEGCSSESALHRAAKREIQRVVREWKAGSGPRPAVSRRCRAYGCGGGVVQDLPGDVTRAAEEIRLPGGAIADLVLYRQEEAAVAIEIVVHSAVDPEKAGRLPIPWMELRAEDVLERPYWWVAVQDGLLPFTCPACEERVRGQERELGVIRERAERVAQRIRAELPPCPPYRAVAHACWSCGKDMLVFAWPGAGRHGPHRPPEPVPPTVRRRVTEGAGDYWANVCRECTAVQGDYYLLRDNADFARVLEIVELGPEA